MPLLLFDSPGLGIAAKVLRSTADGMLLVLLGPLVLAGLLGFMGDTEPELETIGRLVGSVIRIVETFLFPNPRDRPRVPVRKSPPVEPELDEIMLLVDKRLVVLCSETSAKLLLQEEAILVLEGGWASRLMIPLPAPRRARPRLLEREGDESMVMAEATLAFELPGTPI